ncbi:hypothetical protein J3E68DRAFT_411378 [Trichoderma sp. SZMC 28012]
MLAAIHNPLPLHQFRIQPGSPKSIDAMGLSPKICRSHFLKTFRASARHICKRLPRYDGIVHWWTCRALSLHRALYG